MRDKDRGSTVGGTVVCISTNTFPVNSSTHVAHLQLVRRVYGLTRRFEGDALSAALVFSSLPSLPLPLSPVLLLLLLLPSLLLLLLLPLLLLGNHLVRDPCVFRQG